MKSSLCTLFYEVFTIFFYHCGCGIVYKLKLHDGARVFPVHAVWLVIIICDFIVTVLLCSGLWGVLCVGLFSRNCLIEEVYETPCYCSELDLPKTVRFEYQ